MLLCKLAKEAGVPDGVLNLVPGGVVSDRALFCVVISCFWCGCEKFIKCDYIIPVLDIHLFSFMIEINLRAF